MCRVNQLDDTDFGERFRLEIRRSRKGQWAHTSRRSCLIFHKTVATTFRLSGEFIFRDLRWVTKPILVAGRTFIAINQTVKVEAASRGTGLLSWRPARRLGGTTQRKGEEEILLLTLMNLSCKANGCVRAETTTEQTTNGLFAFPARFRKFAMSRTRRWKIKRTQGKDNQRSITRVDIRDAADKRSLECTYREYKLVSFLHDVFSGRFWINISVILWVRYLQKLVERD